MYVSRRPALVLSNLTNNSHLPKHKDVQISTYAILPRQRQKPSPVESLLTVPIFSQVMSHTYSIFSDIRYPVLRYDFNEPQLLFRVRCSTSIDSSIGSHHASQRCFRVTPTIRSSAGTVSSRCSATRCAFQRVLLKSTTIKPRPRPVLLTMELGTPTPWPRYLSASPLSLLSTP